MHTNGISVTGPLPQKIPIVQYPKFEDEYKGLIKKYLSRDIWANLKKKATTKGGSIKCCVKSGVQNQGAIGIFATDEEAYKTFSDLFGPII